MKSVNKKLLICIGCLLVVIAIVIAIVLCLPKDKLPEEGDCIWTAWTTDETGKHGEKTTFTRTCLECNAVQSYEAKPCSHLKYEDDSNGGMMITGTKKSCDCEFMYILSKFPSGKNVSTIGQSAFIDNEKIKHLYIEEGLENIEVAAFAGCRELLSARIPDSVTFMEAQTFFDCNKLYTINVPKGVTVLTEYTYGGCWALREISVHSGVTAVDTGCFVDCIALTEIILPESVKSLGKNAFLGCEKLSKIEMPGLEGELHAETFSSCISLKEFTIPKGITTIKSLAFFNCSGLEKLYIHKDVDTIECVEGESPFTMCDENKLKVYCEATFAPEKWSDGYDICNYIEYEDGKEETPVRAEFIFGATFE